MRTSVLLFLLSIVAIDLGCNGNNQDSGHPCAGIPPNESALLCVSADPRSFGRCTCEVWSVDCQDNQIEFLHTSAGLCGPSPVCDNSTPLCPAH